MLQRLHDLPIFRPFHDLPIKWKLVITISMLVGTIAVFISLYFPAQQERIAVRGLESKAVNVAQMMAYISSHRRGVRRCCFDPKVV